MYFCKLEKELEHSLQGISFAGATGDVAGAEQSEPKAAPPPPPGKVPVTLPLLPVLKLSLRLCSVTGSMVALTVVGVVVDLSGLTTGPPRLFSGSPMVAGDEWLLLALLLFATLVSMETTVLSSAAASNLWPPCSCCRDDTIGGESQVAMTTTT